MAVGRHGCITAAAVRLGVVELRRPGLAGVGGVAVAVDVDSRFRSAPQSPVVLDDAEEKNEEGCAR